MQVTEGSSCKFHVRPLDQVIEFEKKEGLVQPVPGSAASLYGVLGVSGTGVEGWGQGLFGDVGCVEDGVEGWG
jgi:hypothetical protein